MSKASSSGLFITFEGGEGAGKSTQIKILAENLRNKGHDVVITREPGGTPEAEKIRHLLVSKDGGDWSPEAEILLFFAARAMHTRDVILPNIEQGKIVISDRYTDSTRAYQCFGHGVEREKIETVKQFSIGDIEPELTIIFDIDPEIGLSRSAKRNNDKASGEVTDDAMIADRFEEVEIDFHRRLRQGYLEIAQQYSERCKVIDATLSVEELEEKILDLVQSRLS